MKETLQDEQSPQLFVETNVQFQFLASALSNLEVKELMKLQSSCNWYRRVNYSFGGVQRQLVQTGTCSSGPPMEFRPKQQECLISKTVNVKFTPLQSHKKNPEKGHFTNLRSPAGPVCRGRCAESRHSATTKARILSLFRNLPQVPNLPRNVAFYFAAERLRKHWKSI